MKNEINAPVTRSLVVQIQCAATVCRLVKLLFVGGFVTLVLTMTSTDVTAQRPFKRIRDRVRENIPRGELLKKIRDEIESGLDQRPGGQTPDSRSAQDAKGSANAGDSRASESLRDRWLRFRRRQLVQRPDAKSDSKPTPTPADPRVAPRPRANIANNLPANAGLPTPARPSNARPNSADRADQTGPAPGVPPTAPPAHASATDVPMRPTASHEGFVLSNINSHPVFKTAELKRGDRVMSVGGVPVGSLKDAESIMEVLQPGDRIELTVMRKGETLKLSGANGALPDPSDNAGPQTTPGRSVIPFRRGSAKPSDTPQTGTEHTAQSVLADDDEFWGEPSPEANRADKLDASQPTKTTNDESGDSDYSVESVFELLDESNDGNER